MKKLTILSFIVGTVFIIGCGSGSSNSTSSTTDASPTSSTTTSTTCKVSGDTVLVPEGGQCTYSIPSLNGGAVETYKCTNNRVSSNGLSGTTITFNGTTITCE